ncbi:hypothetical protein RYX36_009329 [Vicia faba]
MDMNEKKLTLLGDIDPVKAVSKLRKLCHIEIVSVGPLEEKKEESTNLGITRHSDSSLTL